MDAHNQNILPLRKPKYTQAETGCNMFAKSHFMAKIHIGCIMSTKIIVSISVGSMIEFWVFLYSKYSATIMLILESLLWKLIN